jgi:hypothetical protein
MFKNNPLQKKLFSKGTLLKKNYLLKKINDENEEIDIEQTLYINFTINITGHLMGSPWYDSINFTDGYLSDFLLNSVSGVTSLKLQFIDGWLGYDGNGDTVNYPEYDEIAVSDNAETEPAVHGQMKLIGCNDDYYYQFKIVSSRLYTGKLTTIVVGGVTSQIDSKDEKLILEYNNIQSTSGEILIDVYSPDGNAHINLMEINESNNSFVEPPRTFNVDFHNGDGSWGNVIKTPGITYYMKNINSKVLPVTLIMDSGYAGTSTPNVTIGDFPAEAVGDYMYWNGGEIGTMTISGLNNNKTYNADFISYRGVDGRQTTITHVESSANVLADGNSLQAYSLNNLTPVSGVITFTFTDSSYHYLNAMKITEN